MRRVTLLCVGRLSSPWIADGCRQYIQRLKPLVSLDVHELDASREKDATRQSKEESLHLLSAMAKHRGDTILLDERGTAMTSQEFAKFLEQLFDRGETAEFVIGGAYGVDDSVRNAAKKTIRLSDMTLPHELCRVVFFEQLYRALQIMKGSGYHH